MSKGIRILLSIGAVCAILGLVLSVAGFCVGGRLTSVHVYWDHGPRVRYVDAFDEGQFGVGVFDPGTPAPEAPEAPDAPDAPEPVDFGASLRDVPSAGIEELDVDLGAANVVLRCGDGYDLEVRGDYDCRSEYSGGEWHIYSTEDNWVSAGTRGTPTVRITVPAGTVFDELSLAIGAGTLTADAIECDEAELHVGAGKMELEALSCREAKVTVGAGSMALDRLDCSEGCALEVGAGTMTLRRISCADDCDIDVGLGTLQAESGALERQTKIDCGMGSVRLTLTRPAAYGYSVSGGMGSVEIDGSEYSGMAVDAEQNSGAPAFYEVKCGMGSVKIEFAD